MSAGALRVSLDLRHGRLAGVGASLNCPPATRLLTGRGAAEALEWLPRLYSLCGQAQAAAGRAALAAAGESVTPAPPGRPVLLEAVQEHLWRLLRDWPRKLGVPVQDEWFAQWYRRLSLAQRQGDGQMPELLEFVDGPLLGPEWAGVTSSAALAEWSAGASSPLAPLLRALLALESSTSAPGAAWLTAENPAWDDAWPADFAARPTLAGGSPETGGLARQRTQPLVADLLRHRGAAISARVVARILDLQAMARRLASVGPDQDVGCRSLQPGVGLAWLESARGVLLHRVKVVAGRVVDYQVVSPSAWNFHPNGPFVAALTGLVDRDAADGAVLRKIVANWVLAFDPCVPWHLEVQA